MNPEDFYDEDQECPICGKPCTEYFDDEGFIPFCGSLKCARALCEGKDFHEESGDR